MCPSRPASARAYVTSSSQHKQSGVIIADLARNVLPDSWPSNSIIVYKSFSTFVACMIIDGDHESALVALDLITTMLRLFVTVVQLHRSSNAMSVLKSQDIELGAEVDVASNMVVLYDVLDILLPGGVIHSLHFDTVIERLSRKPQPNEPFSFTSLVNTLSKDIADVIF